MYGPLKEYGATQGGKNVGIAGFGGLGQMGNHTNFPPRATRVQEFKTSKTFKNVSSVYRNPSFCAHLEQCAFD